MTQVDDSSSSKVIATLPKCSGTEYIPGPLEACFATALVLYPHVFVILCTKGFPAVITEVVREEGDGVFAWLPLLLQRFLSSPTIAPSHLHFSPVALINPTSHISRLYFSHFCRASFSHNCSLLIFISPFKQIVILSRTLHGLVPFLLRPTNEWQVPVCCTLRHTGTQCVLHIEARLTPDGHKGSSVVISSRKYTSGNPATLKWARVDRQHFAKLSNATLFNLQPMRGR